MSFTYRVIEVLINLQWVEPDKYDLADDESYLWYEYQGEEGAFWGSAKNIYWRWAVVK